MRPTLAVVIPTFNSNVRLFEECVRSLAAQTLPADAVVVVDDGSEASNADRLEAALVTANLPQTTFVRLGRHRGIAHARNIGFRTKCCDWTLLLDSDDRIDADACATVVKAVQPSAHMIYSDHSVVTAQDTPIHARRKHLYHRALKRWGGTWASPLLHATFIFHAQAYRTNTLEAVGGFEESWGYGDEIAAQLRIEEKFGYMAFRHIPRSLYTYVSNPQSVVHDAALYKRLIGNIECILISRMRSLRRDVRRCERHGRAHLFHAAHYRYSTVAGSYLELPWFDNHELMFAPDVG
jgi:glycosyltransferase involved in cell wall biosynthesis